MIVPTTDDLFHLVLSSNLESETLMFVFAIRTSRSFEFLSKLRETVFWKHENERCPSWKTILFRLKN